MFSSPFFKGLVAAAVGGALSSLTAVSVDSGDLKASFAKMGAVALVGAVTAVVAYFTHSPVQPPAPPSGK